MRIVVYFLLIKFCSGVLLAQDEAIEAMFRVSYATPLTIELERMENEQKLDPVKKKKKAQKKIFFGIKTKRSFVRSNQNGVIVTELFHYMKTFEQPDEYTRDFYWFDFRKKRIVNSLKPQPKASGILHGHYVKKIGDQVIEEGHFYKGRKHGRWVRYNRSDILQDKEYFWKGWPEESLLAFYDYQRTQLKEVIPVKFSERHGRYYAFHPNGSLAATGEYKYNKKVGIWREYYPNRRLKREVVYPDEPFTKKYASYITKEWDDGGKLIFDRAKLIQ